MKKKLLITTLAISMMAMLTACGAKKEEEKAPVAETKIVKDIKGEVEIPVEPKRVVDLSGASDILSVLGYEIVGTANSDGYDYTILPAYLEDVLSDAKILGYSMQETMDVEAIFALEPDLIVISATQEKMYEQLKEIAPTVMVELKQVDFREDFMNVAEIMDQKETAEAWLASYDEKAAEVSKKIKETWGEDTSYLSFLASNGSFFVFDAAAIGNLLYTDLGLAKPAGMPVQEDVSLPVVTYEGLAAIDADVIFAVATDADKAALEENSVWNGLPAVTNGKVVMLPASPYFNQGYSCIGRMAFLDQVMEMLQSIE